MAGLLEEQAKAVELKLWPLGANQPFSLTLALSRWEREPPAEIFSTFERHRAESIAGFARTRRACSLSQRERVGPSSVAALRRVEVRESRSSKLTATVLIKLF